MRDEPSPWAQKPRERRAGPGKEVGHPVGTDILSWSPASHIRMSPSDSFVEKERDPPLKAECTMELGSLPFGYDQSQRRKPLFTTVAGRHHGCFSHRRTDWHIFPSCSFKGEKPYVSRVSGQKNKAEEQSLGFMAVSCICSGDPSPLPHPA